MCNKAKSQPLVVALDGGGHEGAPLGEESRKVVDAGVQDGERNGVLGEVELEIRPVSNRAVAEGAVLHALEHGRHVVRGGLRADADVDLLLDEDQVRDLVVVAPAVAVVAHEGLREDVVDVAALVEQVGDGDVLAEEAAVAEIRLGGEEDVEEWARGIRPI